MDKVFAAGCVAVLALLLAVLVGGFVLSPMRLLACIPIGAVLAAGLWALSHVGQEQRTLTYRVNKLTGERKLIDVSAWRYVGEVFSGDLAKIMLGGAILLPLVMSGIEVWQAVHEPVGAFVRGLMPESKREKYVHVAAIFDAAFDPTSEWVVTGNTDGAVALWKADGSTEPQTLVSQGKSVHKVRFLADGKRVLFRVRAESHGKPRAQNLIWTPETGEIVPLGGSVELAAGEVRMSREGSHIVSCLDDGSIRLFDGNGVFLRTLRGHEERVADAGFSADGRLLATGSFDTTVRVWNIEEEGSPIVLEGHTDAVIHVDISPNGEYVVSASMDRTARVWSLENPGEHQILKHLKWVADAWFAPDQDHVVTNSRGFLSIWDLATGKRLRALETSGRSFNSTVLSPRRDRLVGYSFTKGRDLFVWNLLSDDDPVRLKGHDDKVHEVGFSVDGTRIVSASTDGTARIWNIDGSGEPIVLQPSIATTSPGAPISEVP